LADLVRLGRDSHTNAEVLEWCGPCFSVIVGPQSIWKAQSTAVFSRALFAWPWRRAPVPCEAV